MSESERECEICGSKKDLDKVFDLCGDCYESSWSSTHYHDEDGVHHK